MFYLALAILIASLIWRHVAKQREIENTLRANEWRKDIMGKRWI